MLSSSLSTIESRLIVRVVCKVCDVEDIFFIVPFVCHPLNRDTSVETIEALLAIRDVNS